MSHITQVVLSGEYKIQSYQSSVAIAAARIARNIGFKAGVAYARKRGIKMSLVRLAMQLEATRKAGL